MSRKEKLIIKFKSKPTDISFDELITLLNYFDYHLSNKEKTSGSAVMFVCNKDGFGPIKLHRPHPSNFLKPYQVKSIISELERKELI